MRRYRVEVDGRTHVIDVNELTAHEFQVTVGDEAFTVTLSAAEDLPESVISPDVAEVQARDVNGPDNPLSASRFRPAAPDALPSIVPKAPPPLPPSPERAPGSIMAVKAPMPGTITTIEVKTGDRVNTGQVLLKLEAMKMINAIKSPRDGIVADVPVHAGQSVGYGHVLVAFEEN